MTASSPQKVPQRRSSESEQAGVTLPTLFRIPPLPSGLPEELSDVNAGDALSDLEPREPFVQQEIHEAKSAPLDNPIPGSDVEMPLKSAFPGPKPSYNDLASLPPLDEPTGRSWAESFGSRLVLVLLFAAIATVAVLGTRDVPPTSNTSQIAFDTTSSIEAEDALPGGKEIRLAQVASESENTEESSSTLAQDPQSELLNVPYQALALNTTQATEQAASMPAFESVEPNHGYRDLSQVPPLPEFSATDGRPETTSPVVANSTKSNESFNAASTPQVGETRVGEESDADTDSLTLGTSGLEEAGRDSGNGSASPASLDLPVYETTLTPDAITDWSRYDARSQTVGFQRSAAPQTPGQPLSHDHPLPYDQPSTTQPLTEQRYAPPQHGYAPPTEPAPDMPFGVTAPQFPASDYSAPRINPPSGALHNQHPSWQPPGANLRSPSGAEPYQPQAAHRGTPQAPPYVQAPDYGQPAAPGYYPVGTAPAPIAPPGYPSEVISAYPGQPITQPR